MWTSHRADELTVFIRRLSRNPRGLILLERFVLIITPQNGIHATGGVLAVATLLGYIQGRPST
jgi:hypothetical protein